MAPTGCHTIPGIVAKRQSKVTAASLSPPRPAHEIRAQVLSARDGALLRLFAGAVPQAVAPARGLHVKEKSYMCGSASLCLLLEPETSEHTLTCEKGKDSS